MGILAIDVTAGALTLYGLVNPTRAKLFASILKWPYQCFYLGRPSTISSARSQLKLISIHVANAR